MDLRNYRVDYENYNLITEPKIYIWEEEKTGRIIARIFNTGKKANNSRVNYSRITKQQVNWCMGVFPIDFDRDFIRNWYPTVEFQDELVVKGRGNKQKDVELDINKKQKVKKHFIGTHCSNEIKEKIDSYVLYTGKTQSSLLMEALEKYLDNENYVLEEIKEILNGKYKKIKQVEKLNFFHPNGNTQTILRNDEYFLNYRGNHFIIIDGEDEEYCIYDEDDNTDMGAFILICNHKGDTVIEYYIGWNNEK